MTREDRRSLALHRVIAEHLERDPVGVLATARRTLDRMRSVASESSRPLREWHVILDRPLPALVAVLTDPSPWARELRHVTPFAGILSAADRLDVLSAFREAEEEGR